MPTADLKLVRPHSCASQLLIIKCIYFLLVLFLWKALINSFAIRFYPWIDLITLITAIILVQDTKSCHLGYYCFLLTGLPFLTGFDISYTCPSIDYPLHSSQRGYLKHKSDLVTHLLNNLQGFPITFRIKSKVLILAYKTIHDLGSSILCDLLPFSQILHPPYFSLCLPSMLLNVPPWSLIQTDSYLGALALTVLPDVFTH